MPKAARGAWPPCEWRPRRDARHITSTDVLGAAAKAFAGARGQAEQRGPGFEWSHSLLMIGLGNDGRHYTQDVFLNPYFFYALQSF